MAKQIRPFLFRSVRRNLSILVDFEVNNAQERYAIPSEIREKGFLCRQTNTDEFFILEGGVENKHWVLFDLKWLFTRDVSALEGDFSTNYQTIEEPPDVSTVPVGDSWTHPFKVEEYRLIEQNGQRWWVETTSPKLILTRIFDHTFDKSFN